MTEIEKELKTARKAASTWQSKYQSLKNEFDEYRSTHGQQTAFSSASELDHISDGPDTTPLPDGCPWE